MVFEKIVTKSQVVTKFNVTKSRLHCTLSERISTHCARCQRRKAIRKSSIFRVRPRRANELRLRMHTFRFNEKPVCNCTLWPWTLQQFYKNFDNYKSNTIIICKVYIFWEDHKNLFDKICQLICLYLVSHKSIGRFRHIFVAFSEYMYFIMSCIWLQYDVVIVWQPIRISRL